MMSDYSLTNTQSETNPGFNFARFEKRTRVSCHNRRVSACH